MYSGISRRVLLSGAGIYLSLTLPSIGQVHKFLGTGGVVFYLVSAFFALLLVLRYILPRRILRLTGKQVFWLTLATFIGVAAVFSLLYPIADSGAIGSGCDRDDALNTAVTELVQGRYPYYLRTYQGNPISPLPGSLVLAVPFVLLGNSAYQNIFWLLVFFLAMRRYLKDSRSALLLLWVMLSVSPIVDWEVAVGSDLLANNLFVLLFILWAVRSIPKPRLGFWEKCGSAVLLGIGLSSRLNFILLLPLVFSMLVQHAGWKEAIKYIAITCITWAALTVPFYLYDPQHFSPLHAAGLLASLEQAVPRARLLILSLCVLAAVGLSLQRMDAECQVLFRNAALIQAIPVVCVLLYLGVSGSMRVAVGSRMQLEYFYVFGYGVNFLLFGVCAGWAQLVEQNLAAG